MHSETKDSMGHDGGDVLPWNIEAGSDASFKVCVEVFEKRPDGRN